MIFVFELPLTAVTVETAGVVDGVPTYRYSSFALQQSQKAISAPSPAVHVQKVVELENEPTEETVLFQVLSP